LPKHIEISIAFQPKIRPLSTFIPKSFPMPMFVAADLQPPSCHFPNKSSLRQDRLSLLQSQTGPFVSPSVKPFKWRFFHSVKYFKVFLLSSGFGGEDDG
jgi:hypothetical protein